MVESKFKEGDTAFVVWNYRGRICKDYVRIRRADPIIDGEVFEYILEDPDSREVWLGAFSENELHPDQQSADMAEVMMNIELAKKRRDDTKRKLARAEKRIDMFEKKLKELTRE